MSCRWRNETPARARGSYGRLTAKQRMQIGMYAIKREQRKCHAGYSSPAQARGSTYFCGLVSSAKIATIRSRGRLLLFSANTVITSREPTSREPCSGLHTVPIIAPFGLANRTSFGIVCFHNSNSYGSRRICVVWLVTSIVSQTLLLAQMTVASYNTVVAS